MNRTFCLQPRLNLSRRIWKHELYPATVKDRIRNLTGDLVKDAFLPNPPVSLFISYIFWKFG